MVVLGRYTKILPTRWLEQNMFISHGHRSFKSQVKLQTMLVSFGNLLVGWSVVSISLHAHGPSSFYVCIERMLSGCHLMGGTYQRSHNLDFI